MAQDPRGGDRGVGDAMLLGDVINRRVQLGEFLIIEENALKKAVLEGNGSDVAISINKSLIKVGGKAYRGINDDDARSRSL